VVNRGVLTVTFRALKTCHGFGIYFSAIPILGIVAYLPDLARRPAHVPAAEQMQMEVMHGLAAIVARIYDDAITVVQLFFARNLRRSGHQVANQWCIFGQRLRC